ncbi:uncharacterized protein LOC120163250 [Hibiscus syriacus]|uniref:uncharacterized protein LOC120163250 n=1 Tax=Hibiscus syriacus TaxID=106335 RepID=UPI001923CD88|nr:uncharacterized protein LOC120163250 [Hibiscus syriacus]
MISRNDRWDLHPTLGWFTWHKGSSTTAQICERLDQFVANLDWRNLFPHVEATSEFTAASDHCYLLLNSSPLPSADIHQLPSYFKFDDCWKHDPMCVAKVCVTWNQSGADQCQMIILNQFAALNRELHQKLNSTEAYWRQRSRIIWLAQGDRNTSYFHARSSNRCKHNHVKELYSHSGIWIDDISDIHKKDASYFSTLYLLSNPLSSAIILSTVTPMVTEEMNNRLLQEFTEEEIYSAFLQIHPQKAPSVGLPGNLLNGRHSMDDVNRTVLVLIPKVNEQGRISQVSPIALCTVIYKIVAKVLVNRLRPLLTDCIDDNQNAFIPGRLFTDNYRIRCGLMGFLQIVSLRLVVYAKATRCPHFSVLCAQGLSSLLHWEQAHNRILGLRVCQNGPRITHPFYAEDCLLFLRNSDAEFTRIRDILALNEQLSGQKVNFTKSSIYFSPATPERQSHLCSLVGVSAVDDPGMYLGMPLLEELVVWFSS